MKADYRKSASLKSLSRRYYKGMYFVALRMLVGDTTKYLALVFGLAFSTTLVVQQGSIFTGLLRRTGAAIETIPQAEKAHVVGRFTWQIDADNQLFADGSYYYGKFTQRIAPTTVGSSLTSAPLTMALPPTSPFYPTAFIAGLTGGDPTQPIELAYRTVELGPRTDQAKVDDRVQWEFQGLQRGTA